MLKASLPDVPGEGFRCCRIHHCSLSDETISQRNQSSSGVLVKIARVRHTVNTTGLASTLHWNQATLPKLMPNRRVNALKI